MHKWHYFRFRMQWPENRHPKWWIDLYIADTLIRDLNNYGLLREYLHEEGEPNIEDSSDKHWSIEIQKSWPYFIAGVSEMLPELIDTIRKNVAENLSLNSPLKELKDIEGFYIKINEQLTILWRQEGSHAYFHHINALFGYAPLLAQPRIITGILTSF